MGISVLGDASPAGGEGVIKGAYTVTATGPFRPPGVDAALVVDLRAKFVAVDDVPVAGYYCLGGGDAAPNMPHVHLGQGVVIAQTKAHPALYRPPKFPRAYRLVAKLGENLRRPGRLAARTPIFRRCKYFRACIMQ